MDLSGTWRAAVADEDLRRRYSDPAFDDSGWELAPVPGHWRSVPAFAGTDGPLLYRTPFEATDPGDGRRTWLVFDGAFYQCDVWLDGAYTGDTEGYFFPHTFEVTGAVAGRREHVLAVEVACNRSADQMAKRNITGVFQHWDNLDPDWNPGGIWRPVRLEESGPIRISRLRALCGEAGTERAVVSLVAVLDSDQPAVARLDTQLAGIEHSEQHTLAAGPNRIAWTVTVDHPELWWPHALGGQALHEATVAVDIADRPAGEPPSDTRRFTIGLRQVRMKRWVLDVNGERLFLKGSNQGPIRMALGEATADEFERDVRLAKEANLDLLRVHGHISRPELYAAADRHGVLLWQDFPLQWTYARGIRKQAARQAAEAVDLLGHHPSIAVWCGHNEPFAVPAGGEGAAARWILQQELPTWNKTVLDASVKRSFEKSDPTRPTLPHSGVLPHPGSGGTDSHWYFGWYHGEARDLERAAAAFPRLFRFVGEFGAQAVPVNDEFVDTAQWPDLDWDRLSRTHALQKARFDRYVPPGAFDTYEDWAAATRAYQADLVRHHVETLRRLKYRPTGGFCHFCFADGHPAVTWSVLDHRRAAKEGYAALAAACAPLIVVADRPSKEYRPGDPLALDVHAVSDLREPVEAAVVTATLAWPGGSHTWTWEGDIPPDSCVRIGTVQALAPEAEGELVLSLALESAKVATTNSYRSRISH